MTQPDLSIQYDTKISIDFYTNDSDVKYFLNIEFINGYLYDRPDTDIWLTKEQVKQLRDFLNQLEI